MTEILKYKMNKILWSNSRKLLVIFNIGIFKKEINNLKKKSFTRDHPSAKQMHSAKLPLYAGHW